MKSTANRKVANATPLEADGVRFKSRLELAVWRRLRDAGLDPEYEPEAIELQPPFRPRRAWWLDGEPQETANGKPKAVRALTYTPDFRVRAGGRTWYVEAKGFETDRFPVKRKLLLRMLDGMEGVEYAQVGSVGGAARLIRAMLGEG